MKEVKDYLKIKKQEANEYTKNQKSRRNAIYKNIMNSKLDVNAHLIEFLDDPIDKLVFIEELNKCLNCSNPDECPAQVAHYQPTIQQHNESYTLDYQICNKQRGAYNTYINIKECENYYNNANREPILKELLKGEGGYIWGNGGHGKTFTLGYIANELNKKGLSIYFNLSATIQKVVMNYDDKLTAMELLNRIENCDILLIDDFGGERWTKNSLLSCWVPIIKTRIDNRKPIYFSSNYSLETIMRSIEVETDETTANIVYDRIKTQPVFEFKDKNYRKKS